MMLFAVLFAPVSADASFPGQNGKIAFVRVDPDGFGGNEEIYSVNPDGTGLRNLTNHPDDDSAPAWSPDGSAIAFQRRTEDGQIDVWVMDANGKGAVQITHGGGGEPAWSGDASHMVLSGTYVIRMPDGRHVAGPSGGLEPSWSPVAERIVRMDYYQDGTNPVPTGLTTAAPDGSDPVSVTEAPDTDPDWAPAGDEILFARVNQGMWTVPSGGGAAAPVAGSNSSDWQPVYSPDGTEIAFSGRAGTLYRSDRNGANRTAITSGDLPSWQPVVPSPPPSGYARPRGATPLDVYLVPAYEACTTPNSTHGEPLAFGSCSPPAQASANLTVGTPDANGQAPNSVGRVRFNVMAGDPSTGVDEADVRVEIAMTDVRCRALTDDCPGGALSDYTGGLLVPLNARITDRTNGFTTVETGTMVDLPTAFTPVFVPCAQTATSATGASCSVTTTFDSIQPGTVVEGKRAIWELGQIRVFDATDSANLYAVQGLFVP
jgi:hypothetical protein